MVRPCQYLQHSDSRTHMRLQSRRWPYARLLSGCLLGFSVMLAANASPGHAAAPVAKHIFPAGGQRGTTVQVKCEGEFEWPVQVFAPGVTVTAGEEKGAFSIEIPRDLPVDRIWLRLFNAEGASATIPFLIDSLTELNEMEPNDTPMSAQPITRPANSANRTGNIATVESGDCASTDAHFACIVNGVLHKQGQVDAYVVTLNAGETFVAAVDAHNRIGSPMDAILQLLTTSGDVLAENHDAVGLDPRIVYTVPNSGQYVVRLFAFPSEPDTRIELRGADNYIYRLTLTTGPYLTHALPFTLSGDLHRSDVAHDHRFALSGWNLSNVSNLSPVDWGGPVLQAHREYEPLGADRALAGAHLAFVYADAVASAARVRHLEHDTPCFSRQSSGPTNDDTKSIPMNVPQVVAGCISQPRQLHAYRLLLQKELPVVIAAESPSLDLSLTPRVRIRDAQGNVVARAGEQGGIQDAILHFAPPETGEYTLLLDDRFRDGGERFGYRLTVAPETSDFVLDANSDAIVVTAEKGATLEISVHRHTGREGEVGPITVRALGLPPGLSVQEAMSETTGASAKKITLTFNKHDGHAFSGPIRIVGITNVPQPIERFARTPVRLGSVFQTVWLTLVASHGTVHAQAADNQDNCR